MAGRITFRRSRPARRPTHHVYKEGLPAGALLEVELDRTVYSCIRLSHADRQRHQWEFCASINVVYDSVPRGTPCIAVCIPWLALQHTLGPSSPVPYDGTEMRFHVDSQLQKRIQFLFGGRHRDKVRFHLKLF